MASSFAASVYILLHRWLLEAGSATNHRSKWADEHAWHIKSTDKSQSYAQFYPEHASATDSFYETLLTREKRRWKLSSGKLNFAD